MTSEIIEKPMSAECTMKQYEAIPDTDFVENREYQLTDYPDNGANAEQMAYALTCKRLFPAGTVVTFSGTTDTNYTNGHLYQIQVDSSGTKSWKDITPTGEQSIPILTGTQDKPINLATDLEVGNYYLLKGYIYFSTSTPSKQIIDTLVYKEDGIKVISFGVLFSTGITTYLPGVQYKVSINASGDISDELPCAMVSKLNTSYANAPVSFYAPTTAGKKGQVLQSNGLDAPTWSDPSTLGLATTADIEDAIGNVSSLLGDTSDLEV